MYTAKDVAAELHGYLLQEENFEKLEQIRNQLFLMASVTLAPTQAEENEPPHIQRFIMGQCFERFALQLDEVLSNTWWMCDKTLGGRRRH